MTYIEVWKNGKLLTRRGVDSQKAQTGFRVRLGSAGEVRVALGQPETLGDYEVRVFEGEPPEARRTDQKTASIAPSDAQADSHPRTSQTYEHPNIEGYKIIEPLGEGGMGMVWRAEQLSTRREVALKLLVSHRADSAKAQARFQREVELTARLDHPNIARIYDSGLHHGMYYYAMELIDGAPLDQYVKDRNFSRTQILALMQKVCQAVLYAHLRAVIHRDLKPSNIIISLDGQPHILDFGLAKALLDEDDESLTISIEGQIAGTPAYMSPEQAAGHHDQLDTRTDVFSLGVILYELLTGQSPHDLSGSMFDLLRQIAAGNIRRPSEVDQSIDSELEAILLKALARNPEERYASAGALAKDIANYLDEEPLDARVPTTLYFLRKKVFKYKKQVGIAVVVLFVIFVTIVTAYTRIIKERAMTRVTQERSQLLEAELADIRKTILSGNTKEAEAALNALEEKYLTAQRRAEQLQQKLERTVIPVNPALSETGFILGEPVNLGEPINTPDLDAAPSFSIDGLELYFCSTRDGGFGNEHEDLWVSRRASDQEPWGNPLNLGATVNSSSREFMPYLSMDGLTLLFTSDRPGGYGRCDLYMLERLTTDGPWSEPKNLGPIINSMSEESDATLSADGLALYFSSDRDGGYGSNDIWLSTRLTIQDPWGPPVNLGPAVNTSSQEVMPCISNDGVILLFSSDRLGGYGRRDIYISRRSAPSRPWSKSANLGPVVNGRNYDDLPFISPDGSALYFNSRRPGGFGDYDIWKVPIIPALDFTFGKPVNLGPVINSPDYDRGPSISSNELELYFDSSRPGGFGSVDIWISSRKSILEPWGEPENPGSIINSDSLDAQPYISADGLSLFFHSNRTGGFGQDDIWITTRAVIDGNWTIPKNLGSIINTSSHEGSPCISEDGLTLYFSSDRSGGYGNLDLWFTMRPTISEPWSEPVNFGPGINTPFDEAFPRISSDGLYLYLRSDRPGGYGKSDIWLSRRSNVSEPWSTPVNLGPPVNSADDELVPCFLKTGSTLIFSSDRPGGSGRNDLWEVPILTNKGFTLGSSTSLGLPVDTKYSEVGPSISFDDLTLYFSDYLSNVRPGGFGGADLWVTSRATKDDDWSDPTNLGSIVNSKAHDMEPSISKDELSLYFNSNRSGGNGCQDLWVTKRLTKESSWQEPINLGPIVNSSDNETEPFISADGLSLYFDSDRGNGGNWDIWMTTRATIENDWGEPVNLGSVVNSSFLECGPSISMDGLALFFCSNRPAAYGSSDLWMTTRSAISEPWGIPFNIGSMINGPGDRACANISSDGLVLFFKVQKSDRADAHDIWQVPIIPKVDIDGDGKVNISDVEFLVQDWGPGRSPADIAPSPFGDEQVNKADLDILLQYWGKEINEE
jgi:Tol biopolymer transport system component